MFIYELEVIKIKIKIVIKNNKIEFILKELKL